MPFQFRAADPFAPAVAEAAGAAQAQQANTGTLASLAEQAARSRALAVNQAAAQEADRFAQNARTGAALGQRAQESADELQFKRDAFAASRLPSARDVFAAQVGEAQAQQHAQLQAWVHAQDFTFQDNQRLARQQAALAEVQRAYDQGEITQSEWSDMVSQLRSGIDPAKQRQQRALATQQEAHAQMYLQQARLGAQAEQEAVQLEKKLIESGESYLILPGDGPRHERILIKNPRSGEWYNPLLKGRGGEKPAPTRFGDPQTGEFSFKKVLPEAKAEAEVAYPVTKDKDGNDTNAKNRQEYIDQIVKREQARHAAPPAAGRAVEGSPPDARPFDEDDQASPRQKAQLDAMRREVEGVSKLPIPQQAKNDFAAAVRTAEGLLREYGTISESAMASMSDADRAALTLARRKIEEVKAMRFQWPQPPGGPAAGLAPPWAGGRFDGGKQ